MADSKQTKALAEIWSSLEVVGLDLTDLATVMKQLGIDLTFLMAILKSSQVKLAPSSESRLRQEPHLFPMYSTAVAASFGVISSYDADGGGHEKIDLIAKLISAPERTILLEVTGDSMLDDGIFPGSILIVETFTTAGSKAWLDPQDRDTVIALIGKSDLTVKQFRRTNEGYFLVPKNSKSNKYEPLRFGVSGDEEAEEHEVSIVGIVKKVIQDV